jgi:hypothetical protein
MEKNHLEILLNQLVALALHEESIRVQELIKRARYNAPRVGEKRWSIKRKKEINCSNPKGFSQKQYCKRKARGGGYKK